MAAPAPAMAPTRTVGFEVTEHAITNRNTIHKLLSRREIMWLTCEASDPRCNLILYRTGHAELSTRLSWWRWCRKPQNWSASTRQPHLQEMSGRLIESRLHLRGGKHLNCKQSPRLTIGGWLGSPHRVWLTSHYVCKHKYMHPYIPAEMHAGGTAAFATRDMMTAIHDRCTSMQINSSLDLHASRIALRLSGSTLGDNQYGQ